MSIPLPQEKSLTNLLKSWTDLPPVSQQALAKRLGWLKASRPEQLTPPGDWNTWLILAGRGWGKTKTGAEDIGWYGQNNPNTRIAIVAPTFSDARDVCVEGVSGLLSCLPENSIDTWNRSLGELVLTNKTRFKLFSATQPSRLRGPQHHRAWCDELAVWRYPETWDMLWMGLRLGDNPQAIVTTTPRPTKMVKEINSNPYTIRTTGTTYENKANLSPKFFRDVIGKYEGTRLGRQELNAELLEDVAGALWSWALLDHNRVQSPPETYDRIVVAVDPPVTSGEDADECGIIVAGRRGNESYIIADLTMKEATPSEWAREAIKAYHIHKADRIIAEVNNGGELVETVIRQLDANVSYRAVHASRGKAIRAEPVAALYEQRRVHHIGSFADLESQMCEMTIDFDPDEMGYSPDRVDALVWGITDLMIDKPSEPRMRRL